MVGQNEPVCQQPRTANTAKNYETVLEPIPKKRKKRALWASRIICAVTAAFVLTFCFTTGIVVEYYADETSSKNTTNACYRKREKLAYPGLFTTALGLFSIVLGTLVDRLCLLVEERHHLAERYGGSRKKMLKACFSGIAWGAVITLLLLAILILIIMIKLVGMPWFELSYLVYIFSGFGVGPLVMHLLNLNTQSAIHISTIIEEKGMYVANGQAWSYYFNYLKEALPKFKETINHPFPHPYENIELSLDKLLLVIPLDCYVVDDLNILDKNIEKLFEIGNYLDSYRFPVYRLTANETNEPKYFVIQCVKEPLKTLKEMSKYEAIHAVKRQDCEDEVKLLWKTLSQILLHPPDEECQETCRLIPIQVPSRDSLKYGGLVKCIMDTLFESSCTQTDSAQKSMKKGFRKLQESEKGLTVDLANAPKNASKKVTQTVKTNNGRQSGLSHNVSSDTPDGMWNENNHEIKKSQIVDIEDGEFRQEGRELERKYKGTSKERRREERIPLKRLDSSDTEYDIVSSQIICIAVENESRESNENDQDDQHSSEL